MKFQKGLAKTRIIETTKQYMAVDSIIARPTNSVRVIVGAASGCCAIELRADDTAFPSPSAGNMHPILVENPAVTIDTTAIIVELSILYSWLNLFLIIFNFVCIKNENTYLIVHPRNWCNYPHFR